MKNLIALAALTMMSTAALADREPVCFASTGNWINAAVQSCPPLGANDTRPTVKAGSGEREHHYNETKK